MEKFFRQYDWVLKLTAIGVGAIFLAFILNNIGASFLAPYTVPDLPKFETSADRTDGGDQSDVPPNRPGNLLKRCIVGCPSEKEQKEEPCPGGCKEGDVCKKGKCVPKEPKEEEKKDKPDIPVRSKLDIKLLGTLVAQNPGYSKALLRKQNNKAVMASLGDYITEKAKIIEINRSKIIIKNEGKLEFIPINDAISGGPVPNVELDYSTYTRSKPADKKLKTLEKKPKNNESNSSPKPSPSNKETNPKPNSGSKDVVQKTGRQSWNVEGKSLDKYLDNPKMLAKQGRLVPNYDRNENTQKGLKLTGLSPGSLYSKIGLKTGDVLLAINGQKIQNRRQAFELLKEFQTNDSVRVKIKRGKYIKTLRYRIQ